MSESKEKQRTPQPPSAPKHSNIPSFRRPSVSDGGGAYSKQPEDRPSGRSIQKNFALTFSDGLAEDADENPFAQYAGISQVIEEGI